MMSLSEALLTHNRKKVVMDCVDLIDAEVSSKKGLTGFAVKSAFKIMSKVKPNIIPSVINALLPEFVEEMEPFWDEHKKNPRGRTFSAAILKNQNSVTDALLAVTDRRALKTEHKTAKAAYDKLRPSASGHVKDALPNLCKLLERYVR